MKKRFFAALSLLLACVMLFSGCGSKRTFAESSISFLDRVNCNEGSRYVLLWQDRPTAYKRLTGSINVLAPSWLFLTTTETTTEIPQEPEIAEDGTETPVDPIIETSTETSLKSSADLGDSVDYVSYVRAANEDGIRVWADAVCSDPASMEALFKDESLRNAYVEKVVTFVEETGVNGINIQFTDLTAAQKDVFTALVREIRGKLDASVLVNACVTFSEGGSGSEQSYDYAALAETADYLLLMAFEQYGLATETAGPICSYEWINSNLAKMLGQVSSDQMLLVLPFYGRDFRFDASGTPLWPEDAKQAPVVYYSQLEELYLQGQYFDSNEELTTSADSQLAASWDKTYHAAYVKFTDTNENLHVIWYDDRESMQDKAETAVEYGLAGIGGYLDSYSDMELWKGIRTAMEGTYFSARMMEMLRTYTDSFSVYGPEYEEWVAADDVAKSRLLNLLSVCRMAPSAGLDTGYVLQGQLLTEDGKKGEEIRWIVKEKNGFYLLVPDNEYTSIITSGQSMWLPMGMTPELLEGVCLVVQPKEGRRKDQAEEAPPENAAEETTQETAENE